MSFDRFLKDNIQKDKLNVGPGEKIKAKLLQKFFAKSISGNVHRNSLFTNSVVLKAASIALIFYLGLNLNKLPNKLDNVSNSDTTYVIPHLTDSVNSMQVFDSLMQ
jgi:hypothetical protein